jgi:hypothetical protein
MSDSMFQRLGNGNVQQQQDPRTAAIERMKQMGIDVPKGMENDPNALIQHVMQSGKVPQNRLSVAQQMLMNRFGKR